MSVSTKFLFGTPQKEVYSLLTKRIAHCKSISIVTDKITVHGVSWLTEALGAYRDRLKTLVIGSGTYSAFGKLDELLPRRRPGFELNDAFRVHLGFTRELTSGTYPLHHPTLRGGVFLLDMGDGAVALLGSRNLTTFTLGGLNCEAGVLIEGATWSQEFEEIRSYIDGVKNQSTIYDPEKKHGYAWWTNSRKKGRPRPTVWPIPGGGATNRRPDRTILAVLNSDELPRYGETIYFEIKYWPEHFNRTNTKLHLYLTDDPDLVIDAEFKVLNSAKWGRTCNVIGLEDDAGAMKVKANWALDPHHSRYLSRCRNGVWELFDEIPPTTQQVRVQVNHTDLLANRNPRANYSPFLPSELVWQPVLSKDGVEQIPRVANIPFNTRTRYAFSEEPDISCFWLRVEDLKLNDRIDSLDQYRIYDDSLSVESSGPFAFVYCF